VKSTGRKAARHVVLSENMRTYHYYLGTIISLQL